jgi:hypothetical protein
MRSDPRASVPYGILLRASGKSECRFCENGRAERKSRVGNGGGPAVIPPSPLNQPACKPGSVWREACASRVTTIPLGRRLPGASSNLPGRPDPDTGPGHLRLREDARAVPIRSCSRWGLPCRFRCRKRGALLPHRFTLAPPSPLRASAGGLLSVALSLGPRPACAGTGLAGRYPAPCVHGARTFLSGRPFGIAPSGRPAD